MDEDLHYNHNNDSDDGSLDSSLRRSGHDKYLDEDVAMRRKDSLDSMDAGRPIMRRMSED